MATLYQIIKQRCSLLRKRLFSNNTTGASKSARHTQSLLINASNSSPKICFDIAINLFQITGNAFDDDDHTFFAPIVDWMAHYLSENTCPIEFHIQLNQINLNAFNGIKQLISILATYRQKVKIPIHIEWITDQEEIAEYGEQLQASFSHLPIVLQVEVKV
ncbi:DUF1987 domain-containing protein [uncultured Microscilla sp.]|uniref:DUF1987 domain-containing protein n=1 Tax=uncultured Microscilla sp. TaxID=432653 RepID=UPI0026198502|nr:DUF1987 domain-containing protein [uncultured Microscilla sp.]